MKFYSEKLDTLFDTEEALIAAEKVKEEKNLDLSKKKEAIYNSIDTIVNEMNSVIKAIDEIEDELDVDDAIAIFNKFTSVLPRSIFKFKI